MMAANKYVAERRRAALVVILCLGAVALIATSVYPPWKMVMQRPGRAPASAPAGFHWLNATPHSPDRMPLQDVALGIDYSIDYGRLLLEWLIVLVATGACAGLLVVGRFLRYKAERAQWLEEIRARER